MEAVGLVVNRLIRVSYGPFQLGQLAPGAVEEVRRRVLRDQLGLDTKDEDDTGLSATKPRKMIVKRNKPRILPSEAGVFGERPGRSTTRPAPRASTDKPRAPVKAPAKPSGKPMGKATGKATATPSGKPGADRATRPGGKSGPRPPAKPRPKPTRG